MRLLAPLIELYTLALFIYVALSYFQHPNAQKARKWLGKFYQPLLTPIQKKVKPVDVGGKLIDFTPGILFVALFFIHHIFSTIF